MGKVGPGVKQIMLYIPNELLENVEDFWHDQKISNRNAALKILIERGLEGYKNCSKEEKTP